MIIAGAFFADLKHVLGSIVQAFQNMAFTGSLLLSFAMMGSIYWYSRRRPVGAAVTWGQAMAAAMYVTFILVWFFGVVPDRWLNYAQGSLAMRSDAILAGPGSTGWLKSLPIVISKGTIADLVTVGLYGLGVVLSVAMWAVWQGRGKKASDEVEKSAYGRPLVKA